MELVEFPIQSMSIVIFIKYIAQTHLHSNTQLLRKPLCLSLLTL